MTDDDIQLGAAAGFRFIVASSPDHAVAVRKPGLAGPGITRGWKTVGETHFRRIQIAVGQHGKGKARGWPRELRGESRLGRAQ